MVKYEWGTNTQAKIRRDVEKYLRRIEWLIPKWVLRLRLHVSADGESNAIASMSPNLKYRYADIYVHHRWLAESDDVKLESLIHEVLHLHTSLPIDYATDKFKGMLSEESLARSFVIDDMRQLEEGMTEDLTQAIFDKVYGGGSR